MGKNTNRKRRAGERGFTILETLVAIAILLLATTGPMVFSQQALRAARLSRDQITAFYLAQDAIEFVKHVRDENSLHTLRDEWLLGLEPCLATESNPDTGCQVSPAEWDGVPGGDGIASCNGVADCALFEQNGLFGLSGDKSRFSRRVRIMNPDGSTPTVDTTEEVLVEVKVTWSTLGLDGEKQVLVREHIYNWIN